MVRRLTRGDAVPGRAILTTKVQSPMATAPALIDVTRPGEHAALGDQSVTAKDGTPGGTTSQGPDGRKRILCVFDETYSEHGSLVYSAVCLLISQIGSAASYEVFCQGRYRGPKFDAQTQITEGRRGDALPRILKRGSWWVRRLAVWLHVSESANRWAVNLRRGEEKLAPRLFDADRIQAVIIFAADAKFALRISRLAHIYSERETPISGRCHAEWTDRPAHGGGPGLAGRPLTPGWRPRCRPEPEGGSMRRQGRSGRSRGAGVFIPGAGGVSAAVY